MHRLVVPTLVVIFALAVSQSRGAPVPHAAGSPNRGTNARQPVHSLSPSSTWGGVRVGTPPGFEIFSPKCQADGTVSGHVWQWEKQGNTYSPSGLLEQWELSPRQRRLVAPASLKATPTLGEAAVLAPNVFVQPGIVGRRKITDPEERKLSAAFLAEDGTVAVLGGPPRIVRAQGRDVPPETIQAQMRAGEFVIHGTVSDDGNTVLLPLVHSEAKAPEWKLGVPKPTATLAVDLVTGRVRRFDVKSFGDFWISGDGSFALDPSEGRFFAIADRTALPALPEGHKIKGFPVQSPDGKRIAITASTGDDQTVFIFARTEKGYREVDRRPALGEFVEGFDDTGTVLVLSDHEKLSAMMVGYGRSVPLVEKKDENDFHACGQGSFVIREGAATRDPDGPSGAWSITTVHSLLVQALRPTYVSGDGKLAAEFVSTDEAVATRAAAKVRALGFRRDDFRKILSQTYRPFGELTRSERELVESAVGRLGDPKFATRENAERTLVEKLRSLDPDARSTLLGKAVASEDPEVRARALRIHNLAGAGQVDGATFRQRLALVAER